MTRKILLALFGLSQDCDQKDLSYFMKWIKKFDDDFLTNVEARQTELNNEKSVKFELLKLMLKSQLITGSISDVTKCLSEILQGFFDIESLESNNVEVECENVVHQTPFKLAKLLQKQKVEFSSEDIDYMEKNLGDLKAAVEKCYIFAKKLENFERTVRKLPCAKRNDIINCLIGSNLLFNEAIVEPCDKSLESEDVFKTSKLYKEKRSKDMKKVFSLEDVKFVRAGLESILLSKEPSFHFAKIFKEKGNEKSYFNPNLTKDKRFACYFGYAGSNLELPKYLQTAIHDFAKQNAGYFKILEGQVNKMKSLQEITFTVKKSGEPEPEVPVIPTIEISKDSEGKLQIKFTKEF